MNAIDLLEAILGGGQPGGPAGPAEHAPAEVTPAPRRGQPTGPDFGSILQGRAPQDQAPHGRAPQPSGTPSPTMPTTAGGAKLPPRIPESEMADLPELLRQAREREAGGGVSRPRPTEAPQRRGWSDVMNLPSRAPEPPPQPREEEATILIRAMVNAAKADGRLDRDEEQKLLRHLGQPSREAVAFIQAEFQRPLDAREFAWSVPLGLEQKVYAISLSVIELDQREESAYLKDLAHGLRLGPDVVEQLHRQFDAPLIR